MRSFYTLLLSFCVVFATASAPIQAQQAEKAKKKERLIAEESVIYELMSIDKLSQLYWGIGRLDIGNDKHVDNFMMINQCGIYNEYIHNEFEWVDIREAARAYIDENLPYFPLRFEIMQPIRLGEYDLGREEFEVYESDRIDAMRRFHVTSLDMEEAVCGKGNNLEGYPNALVVEFSRPFDFMVFPLDKDRAKQLVSKKIRTSMEAGTKAHINKVRKVYLVFKLKVFASKGDMVDGLGRTMAHVLAVLEAIEIYADVGKNELLYEKEFRTRGNRDVRSNSSKSSPKKKQGGALSMDEDY